MNKKNLLRLGVWVLLASACLLAKSGLAMEFPEIKAEQLKAKMDAGENLLLINPLSDVEFNDRHIPGSVNIPLQKVLIAELPKDKERLIVTYCLGRK